MPENPRFLNLGMNGILRNINTYKDRKAKKDEKETKRGSQA
jgi:hypothetical protein